jgi:hypothetical protein
MVTKENQRFLLVYKVMIHTCALRAIDARSLEKTSRSSRIWALDATTRPVSSSTEFIRWL